MYSAAHLHTMLVYNCARVYRLEHNYIVRYISQLHVSALMAIFRLDTKSDKKTIYNMVHYIHECGVSGGRDLVYKDMEGL